MRAKYLAIILSELLFMFWKNFWFSGSFWQLWKNSTEQETIFFALIAVIVIAVLSHSSILLGTFHAPWVFKANTRPTTCLSCLRHLFCRISLFLILLRPFFTFFFLLYRIKLKRYQVRFNPECVPSGCSQFKASIYFKGKKMKLNERKIQLLS